MAQYGSVTSVVNQLIMPYVNVKLGMQHYETQFLHVLVILYISNDTDFMFNLAARPMVENK